MGASIGELFIELGVVGNPEQVEAFNKKIKEVAKNFDLTVKSAIKSNSAIKSFEDGLKKLQAALKATAIVQTVNKLNQLTNALVESNQAMLNLTRTSDISLKTFQKWNSIGRMFGVQNAAQQIEGLNQRLFQLRLTGEGASGFQIAGINPIGQDAEGVLEQLRQRIKGLDDTSASWLLQQMGLDPQMLNLLRMEREEFEKLNKELEKYRLTPEQSRSIQQMNIYLEVSKQKLQYLKDRAILAILPAWNKFMESLARVTEGLARFVKWVSDLISQSPQLQSALKGVAAVLGLIFAATHPLLALFGALYLIIDDVMGYFQGKDSLLGEGINYLEDYIQELKEKFGDLTFNKIIPEITIDVTKVIIKAGEISIDNLKNTITKRLIKGDSLPPWLVGLATLFAYGVMLKEKHKELSTETGVLTGGAAPITGSFTGGYAGILPDLNKNFETPRMLQSLSNNSQTYNNDNRQVSQNIQITTTQPAFDIERELRYANMAFA